MMSHILVSAAICVLAAADPTTPSETTPVRARLDAALAVFEMENAEYRQNVLDRLDAAEQEAREEGNKPRLDRVKEQRAAFEKDGTLPKAIPMASYLYKVRESRRTVEGVYADIIKELTQAGDDATADKIEAELHELRRKVVGDRLQAGETLLPGEMLYSRDGRYMFVFQLDGNLTVRRVEDGRQLWASGTRNKRAIKCYMQHDGNLVIRNFRDRAIWDAKVTGKADAVLNIQSDGNVVIKKPGGAVYWATGTNESR